MSQTIIKKIQKNILIINIIIICIAVLYYYFNKNKFDTFKTYIDYTFQEKLFFSSTYPDSIAHDKIKFFLNDLDFNKKFYGIKDLNHANSTDKINVNIDHNNDKISFSFVIKKENDILNIIPGNNYDQKNLISTNVKIIDKFIDKCLNKFHTRIYEHISNQQKRYQKKLEELIELESNQEVKTNELIKIEISQIKNLILEISNFTDRKSDLIIVNDYSKKFRQLHLNTNEYMLSILVLLFLGNILIRNFDKILR